MGANPMGANHTIPSIQFIKLLYTIHSKKGPLFL